VEARGNGKGKPYIQSVAWNGKPWTKSWIAHADLAKGGRLVFEMGEAPNKQFGTAPEDRPPSFGQLASITDERKVSAGLVIPGSPRLHRGGTRLRLQDRNANAEGRASWMARVNPCCSPQEIKMDSGSDRR
jgi:hypothetical protein